MVSFPFSHPLLNPASKSILILYLINEISMREKPHKNPLDSKEELEKVVEEQEREKEKPMEDDAQEDIDTEKVIKRAEDAESAPHPDDSTDPKE